MSIDKIGSFCNLLQNQLPDKHKALDELLAEFDTKIKAVEPDTTTGALNNCHGDWYEWLLAVTAWNYHVQIPDSFLLVHLPNIRQFDVVRLYNNELYEMITDLRQKVEKASFVQLVTSNPDFVLIDTSNIDKTEINIDISVSFRLTQASFEILRQQNNDTVSDAMLKSLQSLQDLRFHTKVELFEAIQEKIGDEQTAAIVLEQAKHSNEIYSLTEEVINQLDIIYQQFIAKCNFNDIVGFLSVKTSFRPDRRLQISHEGSLMKAIYTHLQTRKWIISPKGLRYYAAATQVGRSDRNALKTVATHSITTVHNVPQAAYSAQIGHQFRSIPATCSRLNRPLNRSEATLVFLLLFRFIFLSQGRSYFSHGFSF